MCFIHKYEWFGADLRICVRCNLREMKVGPRKNPHTNDWIPVSEQCFWKHVKKYKIELMKYYIDSHYKKIKNLNIKLRVMRDA